MKIPGAMDVSKSIKATKRSIDNCLNQLNKQAAKLVAKGQYSKAESLVSIGKAIDEFRCEIDRIGSRWKEITRATKADAKLEHTPLWEYYQPILKAIDMIGGTARIEDLEPVVEQLMKHRFRKGDMNVMARGVPRWKNMIRRAKKHMIEEGLLEPNTGKEWKIAQAGRKASKVNTITEQSMLPEERGRKKLPIRK